MPESLGSRAFLIERQKGILVDILEDNRYNNIGIIYKFLRESIIYGQYDGGGNDREMQLMVYQDGETVKICSDVVDYVVMPNGDILYLYDYDASNTGVVGLFDGKHGEDIEEDVDALIYCFPSDSPKG